MLSIRAFGKKSKMFGETSHFLNFALCESPGKQMLDIRNKSGPYKFQNDYMEVPGNAKMK